MQQGLPQLAALQYHTCNPRLGIEDLVGGLNAQNSLFLTSSPRITTRETTSQGGRSSRRG